MLDLLTLDGLLKSALVVTVVLNLKNLLFSWHVSVKATQRGI
jgi:hypothetical protein